MTRTLTLTPLRFLINDHLEHSLNSIQFNSSKDAYTNGTKKQKMVISHVLVDTIYSLEPPGRFLKCDSNTIWRELSRKEASNKAAQAMAYAVRADLKSKPQISSASASPQSQIASSSSHVTRERSTASTSASTASRPNPKRNSTDEHQRGNHESIHDKPSIQQQLIPTQQYQSSTIPLNSNSAFTAPRNGNEVGLTALARAHLLSQAQIQQQHHQQQQLQLRSLYNLLGQHTLLSYPQHSLTSSIQSLSALGRIPPSLDFLLQEHSLRNNFGAGAQPSRPVQLQRNFHGLHDTSSDYNMPNQSMFNAAIASQQGASHLQDQEMLRNLLISSSLAASSRQPQSQRPGLTQHQIALFQQNLQCTDPNISVQDVEFKEDNTAPASAREGQGGMDKGESGDESK